MANATTTNPMVLDTAGVVSTTPVTIKAIQVVFSADADDVLLSDKNGNAVYQTKAGTIATAGSTDSITVPGGIKSDGLTVTTIDGTSVVYLYLK